MIKLKTQEEIKVLREGGKRLAEILNRLRDKVAPGVMTSELEDLARELIKQKDDLPAFLNYRPTGWAEPYPAALCVSVNDEIVHGLPSHRKIKEGDIVGLDLGLNHQGLFTDMAITVPVGEVSPLARQLIEATEAALVAGIKVAEPGKKVGAISSAIGSVIEAAGFRVVEELAGHGVGYSPHEDPFVPNEGRENSGPELVPGLVIAIEPMATDGNGKIKIDDDGFTFKTRDGHLAAHAEKTIVITANGPEILTR